MESGHSGGLCRRHEPGAHLWQQPDRPPGDCLESAGWLSFALTADWLVTDSLKVNLKLDNLFDTRYTRYQDVAGLEAGTDASLFTQSGRTLGASLRYTFVGI